jgi:hypothetical protein
MLWSSYFFTEVNYGEVTRVINNFVKVVGGSTDPTIQIAPAAKEVQPDDKTCDSL